MQTWHAFNWVDYSILILIGLSMLISIVRGFVREAISLATWIVAIIIAIQFSPALSDLLAKHIETPSLRIIIAFAILLISTLIIGALINFLFSNLIHKTGLSGADRLLGVLFGCARGILLVAIIVWALSLTELKQEAWWTSSQLIPHFMIIANWLHGFLPQEIQQLMSTSSTST